MGCKNSKAAVVAGGGGGVAAADAQQKPQEGVLATSNSNNSATLRRSSSKKKKQQQPRSSSKKKNKRGGSQSQQHDRKDEFSSSHSSGSPSGSPDGEDRVYRMLVRARKYASGKSSSSGNSSDQQATTTTTTVTILLDRVLHELTTTEPQQLVETMIMYQHPQTKQIALHVACDLLNYNIPAVQQQRSQQQSDNMSTNNTTKKTVTIIETLLRHYPDGVAVRDAAHNIPMHYVIAAATTVNSTSQQWSARTHVLEHLVAADRDAATHYMRRSDVVFAATAASTSSAAARCTPLYHVLATLPDDFVIESPTVAYLGLIRTVTPSTMVACGNVYSDADKPLALLYRRFTRQFDLAEKFFAGDNSRPEVVQHRRQYKIAAGNTWKMIELLLRPDEVNEQSQWRIVHRAVQVETPPDLLRYIVETNAEDLTVADAAGNLPLHYAAKSQPPSTSSAKKAAFPAFYTKYVVDELLYKFPEAAAMTDADGKYPLTLAVASGKQWIGGGIKSLYDAYPEALAQIHVAEHPLLQRALSMTGDGDGTAQKEEKVEHDPKINMLVDEHHDAIMLVQQDDVDVSEIVTSLWAHEEDAGVQMLGCVAISKLVRKEQARDSATKKQHICQIALTAVAAVVNAMKAHPNEVIVQEKACHALRLLAVADNYCEVSFVASGAVAAIVGAMQAHVSDANVQSEACAALAAIVDMDKTGDRATIVASVSGLTAIVNAVAAHPDASQVQAAGIAALRAMTDCASASASSIPTLPRSQLQPLLLSAKAKFAAECAANVDVVLERLS